MGIFDRRGALQRSYDAVAAQYVKHIYGELEHKPLDRQLLDNFADALQDAGPCVDLGCGPGHVTRYLAERGLDISGIDISKNMVKQARKLNPGIKFAQGDMQQLDVEDNHWASIVSFYSIIHTPIDALMTTLLEFHRVLEPGGALLLAFHMDAETRHLADWWEQDVDLNFYFYRSLHMLVNLEHAGFGQVETTCRGPYPEIESQTQRCYILAEAKPGIPPARRSSSAALT
jgi:ubiquinone/menaquinone biosynthesis C-methylase UbiE